MARHQGEWGPRTMLRLYTPARLARALLLAMAVGALVDLGFPDRAALLPLVVAPFLAAVLLPFRPTVLIAGLSLGLLLVLPESFMSDQGLQYLRLTSVAGVDALAIVSTLWRERLLKTRVRLVREQERARLARREALQLNDGIYQSIFAARMWNELGDRERSAAAVERALASTASLIEDLLQDVPVHPGALVRRTPPPNSRQDTA